MEGKTPKDLLEGNNWDGTLTNGELGKWSHNINSVHYNVILIDQKNPETSVQENQLASNSDQMHNNINVSIPVYFILL